jgi:hypothetical protein
MRVPNQKLYGWEAKTVKHSLTPIAQVRDKKVERWAAHPFPGAHGRLWHML